MSVLSLFKSKETDLINEAHTLAHGALSLFDDVIGDLTHANELLAEARSHSLAMEDYHHDRALDATGSLKRNAAVIDKIAALTS